MRGHLVRQSTEGLSGHGRVSIDGIKGIGYLAKIQASVIWPISLGTTSRSRPKKLFLFISIWVRKQPQLPQINVLPCHTTSHNHKHILVQCPSTIQPLARHCQFTTLCRFFLSFFLITITATGPICFSSRPLRFSTDKRSEQPYFEQPRGTDIHSFPGISSGSASVLIRLAISMSRLIHLCTMDYSPIPSHS